MFFKLLLLLVFLFPTGCASYLVVSGGAVNREKLKEVEAGLVAVRGLKFRAEVAVEVKSAAEMKRYFEQDLEEDYGDEGLRYKSLAYAKLGLIPRGIDLKKSLVDFYSAQVVAFYDPRAKKLVMPESLAAGRVMGTVQFLGRRDVVGEMVLAHELTHALQDQHFSLGEKMRPSTEGDRDLAFRAVIEGDATLSGFAYLFGGADRKAVAQVNQAVQGSLREARSTLSGMPEAIVEEMLFQYHGGVALVSGVLQERGWPAVNRFYAAPPLSTEQVLHPEKYFGVADPPTRVELKNLPQLFQPNWKEIENDVLGELMVEVLFKQFFPENEAKVVAYGWDGDRFIAFSRGEEIAFVWATVWDSEQDAEEFFRGYQRILAKKYPGAQSAGANYLERRGQRVVVVEGLESDRVKRQIETIWQGMELTEEPFSSPFPALSRPLPAGTRGGYNSATEQILP